MIQAPEVGLLIISVTQVAQHSVTKIISQTFVNLVTPKAAAKHEILFNKQASVAITGRVTRRFKKFAQFCRM